MFYLLCIDSGFTCGCSAASRIDSGIYYKPGQICTLTTTCSAKFLPYSQWLQCHLTCIDRSLWVSLCVCGFSNIPATILFEMVYIYISFAFYSSCGLSCCLFVFLVELSMFVFLVKLSTDKHIDFCFKITDFYRQTHNWDENDKLVPSI